MIRVLQITPQPFAAGTRGGGERFVFELCFALQEHVNVDLVCSPGYRGLQMLDVSNHSVIKNIGFRELGELAKMADIVHVHQLNSWAFDLGLLLAKQHGLPLVLTDHGGGFACAGRVFGRLRLRAVRHFALVSDYSAVDLNVGEFRRVSTIWGGGDHVGRISAERVGSVWSPVDFLLVGRILPHKGLHVVLAALPGRSTLRVAGEFRDDDYEQYVRQLAHGKNVDFVGPVEEDDLANLYRSASYVLMPSVSDYGGRRFKRPELLGLVALESISCGVPVICSDVGGLGELARWSGQKALPPGDVEAWKLGLAHALDRTSSRTPAAAGAGLARWSDVAKRCVDIYMECADESK